jgi:phytoene/squalene synthetase
MTHATALLARSITWSSSKQTYLTAVLLADRRLADDCLRGYAYFRWADDIIDLGCQSSVERVAFIARQKSLIDRLYRGECPADLSPEEQLLADLVSHDRQPASGLHSFICNFMAVLEFDALRLGRSITRRELEFYTTCLANAVMDGLQYFIGNGHPYPKTPPRTLAVEGAHYTHMLRDLLEDIPVGYTNIPTEDLRAYGLCTDDVDCEAFRLWVRVQVERARACFQEGKRYIDSLDVFRCKLAGLWYCARFERLLTAIERDGYRLRKTYPERHSLSAWLEMARLGLVVALKHLVTRLPRLFTRHNPRVAL